jgi:hypothetical protein
VNDFYIYGRMLNLKVDTKYSMKNEFKLGNGYSLFNDKNFFSEFYRDKEIVDIIGTLHYNHLIVPPTIFTAGDSEKLKEGFETPNITDILNYSWGPLQLFFLASWFVKDNSFIVETLYLGNLENDNLFKSSRNSWYFSAKGENSEILLTEEELEEIIDWQKKLHDYLVSDEIVPFEPLSFEEEIRGGIKNRQTNKLNESNRITKALNFIQVARRESFLPMKITSYIGAMESLFDVDFELSHQVSERAAKLIGGDIDKRLDNYSIVKNAYDIRSKYVHGSSFNKKLTEEKLRILSTELDKLIRNLLKKVIIEYPEIGTMNKEELSLWFRKLILQG